MSHLRLLPFFLVVPALAHGAVEAFVESFDGDGPYQSLTNDLVGFDNPDWEVYSDDGFAAGGFHIQNEGTEEQSESDILERTLSGVGGFRTRVELNDVDMGEFTFDNLPLSSGQFVVSQKLREDGARGLNRVSMLIQEAVADEPVWTFTVRSSGEKIVADVPRGARVALELIFDVTSAEVTFTYDDDHTDEINPLLFGPLPYTGTMQEAHLLSILSSSGAGKFDGVLDSLSVTPMSDIAGDFNANGILDAADIDELSAQIRANTTDLLYDLNADASVDDLDRQTWVHDLKQTYFGDADLNGAFDSTDLVQVLASGEYEDGVDLNSIWLSGDWDGDGDFTSGDLVVALADGGYEAGAAAVPEPAVVVLTMTIVALAVMSRRLKTRRK